MKQILMVHLTNSRILMKKNILGMMPHPERMIDPALSGEDGLNLFSSLLN